MVIKFVLSVVNVKYKTGHAESDLGEVELFPDGSSNVFPGQGFDRGRPV